MGDRLETPRVVGDIFFLQNVHPSPLNFFLFLPHFFSTISVCVRVCARGVIMKSLATNLTLNAKLTLKNIAMCCHVEERGRKFNFERGP